MSFFSSLFGGNKKGLTFNKFQQVYNDFYMFNMNFESLMPSNMKKRPERGTYWESFDFAKLEKVNNVLKSLAVFLDFYNSKIKKGILNYEAFLKNFGNIPILEVFKEKTVEQSYIPSSSQREILASLSKNMKEIRSALNSFLNSSKEIQDTIDFIISNQNTSFQGKGKEIKEVYKRLPGEVVDLLNDLAVLEPQIRQYAKSA